ncbi:MAG: hypothetical protein A2068_02105 [Ignavibacteria bacterium GWB2_35_6b]|nr:MAG: hypothetical protein A2068_02105 [Ignavibacteria bacterium GWB2_35_6b]
MRILIALLFIVCNTFAQKMQSDNEDGTYTNPVIAADYPDPDVIRVDSVYYFVSTTMFIFPGVTILKSYDLVNWEYCRNAVPRFDYSPCYNLEGCNRYRHGQWATSLKYHNGKFHLLFITLDEGGFYLTADKAEGPWKITNLPKGFYDPGLFFDNDGKIYVAHGYNKISITEVDSNLIAKGEDVLVYTGDIRNGLEGAHVYKINDYYYLYCTYGGLDGFQVALRSKNIYGPYEQKIVIRDTTHGPNYGIHQGALIQIQTGEWWTMLFADSGPFGRFPSLQPITWENGWPKAGVNGNAIVNYKKPNVGKKYPIKTLPTSDEFINSELGMQWGWNHNPEPSKWSLTENPGHLRIYTVTNTDSLTKARNTLTQRMFAYYSDSTLTVGTTKIDINNMKDGDIAGLAIFQDPYGFIGVKKINGKKYITMVHNGSQIDSAEINTTTIYLRVEALYGSGAAVYYGGNAVPETGTAKFSYSLDNKSFSYIGDTMQMEFKLTVFTGNKFCLFNYPTKETGGYVDFDWFRTSTADKN